MIKAVVIWIAGLLTLVPYGVYYLFFQAQKSQYALLIVLILFWVFGYWSVVGPLLMLAKVRSVFRAIQSTRSKEDLVKALASPSAKDVAIDLIATDNHVPRFVAARVYDLLIREIAQRGSNMDSKARASAEDDA